jgi:hypothetical protein
MKKIETLMNDAISNKVDFKSANTEVIYYTGNDISDVYLHGNLIARVYAHSIELMDGGYQSNTTKSPVLMLFFQFMDFLESMSSRRTLTGL